MKNFANKIKSFFKSNLDIIRPTAVLALICIVVTLALSSANFLTENKIEALAQENQNKAMSKLIKAGFGYDCSLKILNSSMLFKSSDESLATMDIASIDLFTGNTELYKAGAAPTLVRRNGKSGRAESTSLPIGILKDVSFDRAGIRLRANDILLMVSDGVTFDGTEWLRQELENWRDGGAQDLAEHICDCARRRQTAGKPDDITVIAAIIEKTDR